MWKNFGVLCDEVRMMYGCSSVMKNSSWNELLSDKEQLNELVYSAFQDVAGYPLPEEEMSIIILMIQTSGTPVIQVDTGRLLGDACVDCNN